MAITNPSSSFPAGTNYQPRLITVDDSLTRVSIKGMTKEDIEGLDTYEVGLARIFAGLQAARICGVKAKGFYDFIYSRLTSLTPKKGPEYESVIQPFTLVPREHEYNACFFQLEAGAASPAAGQGSEHPGLWDITVNNGSSWLVGNDVTLPNASETLSINANQGVKNIEKYFLPGQYVVVEYVDGSSVSQTAQFKVVSAVNANAGGVEKAKVTLEPARSASGWAGYANKAIFQPTAGQVSLLANSISNYESYGYQKPAVNAMTFSEYWKQTMRWSHSYNDEYVKAMQAKHTTEFFKRFQQTPIAKQRAQLFRLFEIEMMNTVWFGQRINENQTTSNWRNLEQIKDPTNSSLSVEFRANTLGIRTQIQEAGRVSDRGAGTLYLKNIIEAGYYLARARGTDIIDVYTDRDTRARLRAAMYAYYKTKLGADATNINIDLSQQKQMIQFNGLNLFNYDVYDIIDEGYQLAVFSDPFFDDRLASFASGQKSRGRCLFMCHPGDINVNVLNTASVQRTTNEADELFRYVISPVVTHTLLESMTMEVRLGNPDLHLVIENFDGNAVSTAGI